MDVKFVKYVFIRNLGGCQTPSPGDQNPPSANSGLPLGWYLTAAGVEFIHAGKTLKVHANKEVILCAGTIKSPQILELSGIGRKEILENIGVECKVDLRGVGEKVQDHTYLETYDLMRNPEFAAEAKRLQQVRLRNLITKTYLKGMHRIGITSFAYFPLKSPTSDAPALIKNTAESVDVLKKSGKLEPGQADILNKKIQTLKDDTSPDLEIIAFPGYFTTVTAPKAGKSYATILIVLNHPLSHGTIHATSNDPPAIDPVYFEINSQRAIHSRAHLENLVQHIKSIRFMNNTEPWKSSVVREMDHGPNFQTDEDIRNTIGSTPPLNKQSVVSPELKVGPFHFVVYGTTNLRGVDVGIVPIHLATHTHVTAYVIAEKGSLKSFSGGSYQWSYQRLLIANEKHMYRERAVLASSNLNRSARNLEETSYDILLQIRHKLLRKWLKANQCLVLVVVLISVISDVRVGSGLKARAWVGSGRAWGGGAAAAVDEQGRLTEQGAELACRVHDSALRAGGGRAGARASSGASSSSGVGLPPVAVTGTAVVLRPVDSDF
ncbi:GMC oxidoreductase-domain-containing protein [Mycena rosella]|uniref:GMC oxidoreductase-domain-containing protein n=1 Tax=Mycena rosella TaxID=1033263 RepID=A0AAD7BVE3_MYCRO|nr:GMC oxidoreductase-domain-containing protein [Mycena rosella]